LRDYSSPAIVEPQRDDPETYFTQADLAYIKSVVVPLMMQREGLTEDHAGFQADLFLRHYYPEDKKLPEIPKALSGDVEMRLYRTAQAACSILFPRYFARTSGLNWQEMQSLRTAQGEFIRFKPPNH
jgi:hypothetical protein